jgi:CubicO group peptidase (beta-lactamase class C family)
MKKLLSITFLGLFFINSNYSLVLAHHANEKYCFDCMHKYKIGGKKNDTYEFEINLQNNDLSKRVDEQLKDKKTGLVSYILFANNKILVDQNRKSKYRRGYYPSHSVGKSFVGLVTGYAVCGGYINHTIFDRIDYPTVAGTLYEDQKLINLLNMTAGDDGIIGERLYGKDNPIRGKGPNTNTIPIKKVMKKYFKDKQHLGLEPGLKYNYSALTTNVVMNYVIYKTGDDWEELLHKVFVEDAKVEKRVYFGKTLNKNKVGNRKSGEYGRYSFYAQRYDYLRIAKLILDHWNNDTCVGKYLKTIYENRVDKNFDAYSKFRGNHNSTQSYGGQFHFDPIDIDRPILMMDGAYGQQVVIDFDNNRIITVHSTDRHYDYYSLIYLQLEPDLSYRPVKNN